MDLEVGDKVSLIIGSRNQFRFFVLIDEEFEGLCIEMKFFGLERSRAVI